LVSCASTRRMTSWRNRGLDSAHSFRSPSCDIFIGERGSSASVASRFQLPSISRAMRSPRVMSGRPSDPFAKEWFLLPLLVRDGRLHASSYPRLVVRNEADPMPHDVQAEVGGPQQAAPKLNTQRFVLVPPRPSKAKEVLA
jgi:hypothetical protein